MFHAINANDKMIFSIDGNIGSGKSTLFEELKVKFKTRHDIKFIEEPVDEWAEIKDESGKLCWKTTVVTRKNMHFHSKSWRVLLA